MRAAGILMALAAFAAGAHLSAAPEAERVYVDDAGMVRWTAGRREVALFGANYCLPSSSDYRAAGYVGADRKKLIERDLAHFARMGWDGMRLALWGDWENCDREGNLIVNDHLDLFDYLIFQAKQRGISMLFTPIHRHSALWPDGKDSDAMQGFSKFYPPSELGTNPAAIAAQQNYLRQVLAHVNPYTGVALKDEPAIVFIELINEPHHHADDFAGSVAYINALVDAVRSTGCQKILFHNLSQDFPMAPAIAASKAQGFTFGWYPTALVSGHTLEGNYLRWADEYTPLKAPEIPRLPRIVYEFDSADMTSGYMYPAMVRAFREVGAQFAAMFAYDMLDTAPYNLGWQTHYLNLVYSPRKAVSAIIAAEAMRTLPRGIGYGGYPENRRFGPFRVSYEEDSSEMVTAEKFLYANNTATKPPQPSALRQVIGCGSSPIVSYEGNGSYFLEKIADGQWRLEVYPDEVFVQDPFSQRLNFKTVSSRLIWHSWPMKIALPDLGPAFDVAPLNTGNHHSAEASTGRFEIRPGVYLLTHHGNKTHAKLPGRLGRVGIDEFVCPPATDLPTQVIADVRSSYTAGEDLSLDVDVLQAASPREVKLHLRSEGEETFRDYPMRPSRGYRFHADVPGNDLHRGKLEIFATVDDQRFPNDAARPWTTRLAERSEPLTLFDAAQDGAALFSMRVSGDRGGGYTRVLPSASSEPATLRIDFPTNQESPSAHHAVSLPIKKRIANRGASIRDAKALRVTVRGTGGHVQIGLLESDGTPWIASLTLSSTWTTVELPLRQLTIGRGFKLPLGYPGNWNYEMTPPSDRGQTGDTLQLARVEQLQIFTPSGSSMPEAAAQTADIASVELVFE